MTYCAPCLADLALVRESATTVLGTAACMAHAVLLSHPRDEPGRRRARLSALRDLAEAKQATASPDEQPALELLVQEYALAGVMDTTPGSGGSRERAERGGRGRGPAGDYAGRPAGEYAGRGPGEHAGGRGPGEHGGGRGPQDGTAQDGTDGERRPGKSRRQRPPRRPVDPSAVPATGAEAALTAGQAGSESTSPAEPGVVLTGADTGSLAPLQSPSPSPDDALTSPIPPVDYSTAADSPRSSPPVDSAPPSGSPANYAPPADAPPPQPPPPAPPADSAPPTGYPPPALPRSDEAPEPSDRPGT